VFTCLLCIAMRVCVHIIYCAVILLASAQLKAQGKNATSATDSAVQQALQFYPELKHLNITFKYKPKKTPFTCKPQLLSTLFKPAKRKYVIIISTQSNNYLNSIIKDSLSYNAQVGVIGHELSHITEFNSKRTWFFILHGIKHLSKKYIDTHEYNTDYRCIQHGMGKYLLAWSKEVREKLNVSSFNRGKSAGMQARERYMHPATIERVMLEMEK
jgi:hypothetical protein